MMDCWTEFHVQHYRGELGLFNHTLSNSRKREDPGQGYATPSHSPPGPQTVEMQEHVVHQSAGEMEGPLNLKEVSCSAAKLVRSPIANQNPAWLWPLSKST